MMSGGDQAGALRDLVSRKQSTLPLAPVNNCSTLAVTSGKGGVGKTNFSIFLARTLASRGERVLLFDGDLGLANLHILLGVNAPFTMKEYLTGKCSLQDVIYEVEPGVDLLPGTSGNVGLANISTRDLSVFIQQLETITSNYDRMIVDGGAGIAESSLNLTLAADEIIVVITPDPTSLADAYATIKVLAQRGCTRFDVVVNMFESEDECDAVEEKLSLLTDKFLGLTPQFVGRLPRNRQLASQIRLERSLLNGDGLGDFLNRMNHIAEQIAKSPIENTLENSAKSFFERIVSPNEE